MSINGFTKKMIKFDLKKSYFYIFSIAVMTMLMFNAINISYNDNMYNNNSNSYIEIENTPKQGEKGMVMQQETSKMSVGLLQKQNLFFMLVVAAFYGGCCNINQIKRKGKDIAFILANGSSLGDVQNYLICTNGINYIIGAVLGIGVGTLCIPLFNMLMYRLMDISGQLFTFNSASITMTLAYVFVQFAIVIVLNFGYIYRKEIIDLFKLQNTISFTDKRSVKTPWWIFLGIYMLAIILIIYSFGISGGENGVNAINYLGVFGLYGMIKYVIPKIVEKLKKRNFMYKNNRVVYFGNFLYSLSNSVMYLLGTMIVLNFFCNSMFKNSSISGLKESCIFALVGSIIIISLSLVYNLLVDTEDKVYIYRQMKMLGFKRSEILEKLRKETILLFTLGLCLAVILNLLSLNLYVFKEVFSIKFTLGVIIIEVVPLITGAFVSYQINKKVVDKELYSNYFEDKKVIA